MNLSGHVTILVVVIAFAASCSHSPRLPRGTQEVASLRAEYLQNNPDDPFKGQILNSEVSKGMNVLQVLASWGLPNVRRGYAQGHSESWTYYAVDEHTQKLLSYELVFYKSTLSLWVMDGDAAGLGTLTPRDLIGIPTIGETPIGDPAVAPDKRLKKK
ncbi:MAG: hypothetical protein OEN01_07030 [Candidatus Krumholzibacteria bacterium]|nr:hypothetical protein [Candidatus Krumholzibacteria bacterium]